MNLVKRKKFQKGGNISYFKSLNNKILNTLNYAFPFIYIQDRWKSENPNNTGLNSDGTYSPHDSAEGGSKTVGPGIKLGVYNNFQKDKPYTISELNQQVANLSKQHYNSIVESLGTDTISPQIMRGLIDLAYQIKGNDLGKSYPKLLEQVRQGNLSGIKRESKVYWTDKKGRTKEDKRRNNFREENFWYYE